MEPIEFKDSVFFRILEKEIPEVSIRPEGMERHFTWVSNVIAGIPARLKDHAYAEGKWTLAQVLGHLVDSQTVFLYRMLSLARGDSAILPGFDEAGWVAAANYGACSLPEIRGLYDASANHVLSTALRLGKEELARRGQANGIRITAAEVLIYLMAHERHHVQIVQERYLPE